MKENELLDLIHRDPSLGIERALDQYGGAVKTICRSILSGYPQEEVEEAISDTFVGLWKSREKIRLTEDSGLKSYLYGIARITALDRKRKLAREKKTVDLDEVREIAAQGNLEETAVKNLEYEMLYQLIQEMGEPDRDIFIYKYQNDFSMKEIAQRLSLSVKAVENRLMRGRQRLKRDMMQWKIDA